MTPEKYTKEKHNLDRVSEVLFQEIAEEHAEHPHLQLERDHARDVEKWILALDPEAGLALRFAGNFHDIDRVVTSPEIIKRGLDAIKRDGRGVMEKAGYSAFKIEHAKRSAAYVTRKLKEQGIADETINRVVFLIEHHDDDGEKVRELNDPELAILVAADTFAFFDTFAEMMLKNNGEDSLADKIRFMVDKMPPNLRSKLKNQTLSNSVIERIKNRVLDEFEKEDNA